MSANTPVKVLLVEDHDHLSRLYLQHLEAAGFDAHLVASGSQALQEALDFRPALIVLDTTMPQVSGYDLLDILRHTPEMSHAKIILLAPVVSPADRLHARELGADLMVKSEAVIGDVIERLRHHSGK